MSSQAVRMMAKPGQQPNANTGRTLGTIKRRTHAYLSRRSGAAYCAQSPGSCRADTLQKSENSKFKSSNKEEAHQRARGMNCMEYVERNLKETNIHGLSYLMRDDLHWSERVFWLAVILSVTYFSINICLNQWERFRDNPIVYAMEITWGKKDFPSAGITLCSNYHHRADLEAIILNLWGHTTNDSKFEYYREFLKTLNTLRFDALHMLAPYENDTTLQHVNLLDTLLAMHKRILPSLDRDNNNEDTMLEKNPVFDMENQKQIYAAAITEAGLCRTTSQLSEYTNPYGESKKLSVSDVNFCSFIDDCNSKIYPMYLHNVYDLVSPRSSTIYREAKPDGSLTIELLLSWTMAVDEVRNLPIIYRRCRYPSENNLKYFQTYRPNLCRMECRIDAALEMCKCKPFFYAVAPNERISTIDEMLCLQHKNWSQVTCDCFSLCEEINYTGLQSMEQKDETSKFERTIIVKLSLPYMAAKRRVVFSSDQLVVSWACS